MNTSHLKQYKKIIENAIEILKLDLSGLVVLTEAGSGPFLFTPIIASKANAKKIFVCTNDSAYGKAAEITKQCEDIFRLFNLKTDVEFILNKRPFDVAKEADIITNSAHIRPLDKELLSYTKSSCVIPLMYEKWELRTSDIDVEYCKLRNIKIAGTWENFPTIKIFDYCEQLIIKMAFEAGYEIARNNILVWSNDHYGELAVKGFTSNGAKSVKKIFSAKDLYDNVSDTDFIFFCDYLDSRKLVGENSEIKLEELKKINPSVGIVHLSGDIDNEFVKSKGFPIYPDKTGYPVRMTFTLAHLGKRPTIYLNAAGLKVGECLSRGTRSDLLQLIN